MNGIDERTGMPIVPDNALIGRIGMDLSSVNPNQIQIPGDAQGLSVIWVPDSSGNIAGSLFIFAGETGPWPWMRLAAPTINASIANGPLPKIYERGAYLTVVPAAGCKGLLIFEFLSSPISRTYTTS